jgi:16S rRNA (guanine1207-N2)-methyltransferase
MGKQTDNELWTRVLNRWSGAAGPLGKVLTIEATPLGASPDLFETCEQLVRWARYDMSTSDGWPPEGAWDTVLVRMPRAKLERSLWIAVAGTRLSSGGRCVFVGRNDEGIKSVKKSLEEHFDHVVLAVTKHRARVYEASGYRGPQLGASLDWLLEVSGAPQRPELRWKTLPGCFAHGRVDNATSLLLDHLPVFAPGECALDYGCGPGVLTAAVSSRGPHADWTMLDIDAYALGVAALNCPHATTVQSDAFGALRGKTYDRIISNPPFHIGNQMTYDPIRDFLSGLALHLRPNGEAWFVVPHTLPIDRWAKGLETTCIHKQGVHAVWKASRP